MRIPLLTFVLFFTTALYCSGADVEKPKEIRDFSSEGYVGLPVPSFEAVANDNQLSSSNHGASVLIIDLWGLNCASCLDEMKALELIYSEYRSRGLKIWAVNTEDIGSQDMESGLEAKNVKVSYDVISDPGLEITKLFTSWFIPVTIIVDRQGIVQYYKIGFNEADADKIKAKVGALLAQ